MSSRVNAIPRRYVSVSVGRRSLRVERRGLAVACALAAIAALIAVWSMTFGEYGLSVGEVIAAMRGTLEDGLGVYFVRDIRLPRVIAGLGVGAALGMSGAIIQSLSANPLGSPDIIGFTTGSATGALLSLVIFEAAPSQVSLGAVIGGLVTAAIVYGLSYRDGVAAARLVLVGVGVGAVLAAINSLIIVRASLSAAQNAAVWLAGSLNAMTWHRVVVLGVTLGVLVPVAACLVRSLQAIMLGDDVALALGVRVERVRLALVVVSVALVSIAVATAGPVGFVALVAPQLARRLTKTAGVGLGSSAAMGALLVTASDLAAQRIFAPTQLPVGVITGTLGGTYLVWLLIWQWRRPL